MPFVESSQSLQGATGSDVIEEVQRLLLGGQTEELNKLAINAAPGATTLSFEMDMGGIREGSLIEVDQEVFRVWRVDEAGRTATVQPAMQGTKSTTHVAGALVSVNPRLSRSAIFKALNDELRSLSTPSNGLFRMKTYEFDYNASVFDYEIPATDLIDVYDVREQQLAYSETWLPVTQWRLAPKSDAASFPSGNALHLPYALPGTRIQVLYKARFGTLSDGGDNIAAVTGLPLELQDILPLGCLLRLGPVREIKRNFTEAQGDARRAGEVPPGSVANSFTYVRAQRQQRIDQEAQRLWLLYPDRHR